MYEFLARIEGSISIPADPVTADAMSEQSGLGLDVLMRPHLSSACIGNRAAEPTPVRPCFCPLHRCFP